MNKRAMMYLGAISATLACAFLYVQFKSGWADKPSAAPVAAGMEQAVVNDTAAAIPQLRIQGGKLQTEPVRIKVKSGEIARLQVFSDETDELHVHGIDKKFVVYAGRLNTLEIATSQTGSFELEMHDRPMNLGVLEVHPR